MKSISNNKKILIAILSAFIFILLLEVLTIGRVTFDTMKANGLSESMFIPIFRHLMWQNKLLISVMVFGGAIVGGLGLSYRWGFFSKDSK